MIPDKCTNQLSLMETIIRHTRRGIQMDGAGANFRLPPRGAGQHLVADKISDRTRVGRPARNEGPGGAIIPSLLFALALLLLPDVASAQLWSGILDPARAIRWQDNAGVPGGVPSASWTQCGSTLSPGVTMAQITSAIAACGSNQYVQLAAGTFTLTSGTINFAAKGNVALRGMGPLSTILTIRGSGGCFISAFICVAGSNNYTPSPQRSTTWTAGYAKGTTTITLGNAAGIVAGQ